MSASKWEPYPNYTESNFDFIPKYPSHWELKRMQWIGKFSASGIDKKSVETESDCLMVNYTDVYGNETAEIHSNQEFMKTTATSQKITEHHLKKGDILFTPSSETADDIGVSAVALEDMSGTVYSYHLTRFRPSIPLGVNFSRFFCNSIPVLSQLSAVARGTTRQILSRDDFNTLNILVPSVEERLRIGHFLSEKDKQITANIKRLESKLRLLEEKRSTLITQAVTKGLNPNVAMKDSGIDYIGLIPENWTVGQISKLFDIKAGGDLDREHFSDKKDQLHKFPIYTNATDENSIYGFTSKPKFNSDTITVSGRGDVGYAIYRDHAYDAIIRLLVLEPKKNYNCMFFKSCISEIIDFKVGSSAINQLSTTQISPYYVPIPPIDEQNEIAEFLSKKINLTLQNVKKIKEQIITLNEYRNALISAAVTGKIDVSNYQME